MINFSSILVFSRLESKMPLVYRDICKFKRMSTLRELLHQKGLLFSLLVQIQQTSLLPLRHCLALPPDQTRTLIKCK